MPNAGNPSQRHEVTPLGSLMPPCLVHTASSYKGALWG